MSATVTIEPWGSGDLPLLERLMGEPGMTEHLGGPETINTGICGPPSKFLSAPPPDPLTRTQEPLEPSDPSSLGSATVLSPERSQG